MDLPQLAQLGEFVGGIAVLVTLIYLATQVRQSNRLGQAETIRAAARDYNLILLELKEPGFAESIGRAHLNFDSLSKTEQIRTNVWFAAVFVHGQSLFLLRQSQLVDEKLSENASTYLASMLKSPGIHQWWQRTKALLEPSFVRYIEARAASPDSPPAVHEILPWYVLDETNSGGAK